MPANAEPASARPSTALGALGAVAAPAALVLMLLCGLLYGAGLEMLGFVSLLLGIALVSVFLWRVDRGLQLEEESTKVFAIFFAVVVAGTGCFLVGYYLLSSIF
ncbi:MAG TPA: hypothetical protein VIF43_02940 [Patescibacteria group bacterium]|jgi:4-amino-4-deoxy-L-arabinose transferase-like glycosyltransferase